MKRLTILALLIGLAAVTALVIWQGAAEVGDALRDLGLLGVLLLLPIYVVYLLVSVFSLRFLFPLNSVPGLVALFNALWIGGSVNTIFPVAQLGGEAVKARVLHYYGTSGPIAASAALADTTVAALSLAAWGLLGVAAMAALQVDAAMTGAILTASALFAGGVVAFFVLQRIGVVGFLAKSAAKLSGSKGWGAVIDNVKDVDTVLRDIYRNPAGLFLSVVIRVLARCTIAFEIWVIAYFMGHPVGLLEALMIRSLVSTLRGAAFFVPQGLGLQEGAFIILGGLIGIPPELALSMSLATRARELLESAAGVLYWQHLEGRSLRELFRNGRPS